MNSSKVNEFIKKYILMFPTNKWASIKTGSCQSISRHYPRKTPNHRPFEVAEADSAVLGWAMLVDELFV
ncbi:hypothetical protein ACEYW6_21920 [Nostoc sp. UIC 10607]|uniref:hypothetical protein n=1 Tax=Nostoc sp. UIC 10607 TaxID=3045935 RepID=UPI00399F9A72